MCFDLNTGFARLINTHSVLFRNVARLNLQFDVLDLNTGLVLVVKTLPDGTFSSIWVNKDGIRTLFVYPAIKSTVFKQVFAAGIVGSCDKLGLWPFILGVLRACPFPQKNHIG